MSEYAVVEYEEQSGHVQAKVEKDDATDVSALNCDVSGQHSEEFVMPRMDVERDETLSTSNNVDQEGSSDRDDSLYAEENHSPCEEDVEDKEIFECTQCGKILSSERYLKLHCKNVHNYKLETRKVGRPAKLKKVKDEVKSPKSPRYSYECPCCKEFFHSQPALGEHITQEHNGEHHYACTTCGKKFLIPLRMNDHKRKVHVVSRTHVCAICEKSFKDLHALKRHLVCFHNDEKNFSCEICGTQFKMKYSLVAHRKNVHGDGEHDYECDLCKKVFLSRVNLERHKQCVHFAQVVGSCEHCGKTFTKLANMTAHVQAVHGTERNFKCELCDKSFKRKQQVVEHMKNVHTGERNYSCPFEDCGKAFKKGSHLKAHVRSLHEKLGHVMSLSETQGTSATTDYQPDCASTSYEVGMTQNVDTVDVVEAISSENQQSSIEGANPTKAVVLSTDGQITNVTSFDALRAIHSFIYEHESSEEGSQFFIDVRRIPNTPRLMSETESSESFEAVQEDNMQTLIQASGTILDGQLYSHVNGSNVMVTAMVHSEQSQ